MTYLLDTATAVWLDQDQQRMSPLAREILADRSHLCFLSVISIWEMEVKVALGKLPLGGSVRRAVDTLVEGYRLEILELNREACHQQGNLPWHHRDPFDRLLICQSIAEGAAIVTPDTIFQKYPVRVIW